MGWDEICMHAWVEKDRIGLHFSIETDTYLLCTVQVDEIYPEHSHSHRIRDQEHEAAE